MIRPRLHSTLLRDQEMTPPTHLRYSLALSVMSAPGQRGLWDLAGRMGPEELYDRIILKTAPSTQDFIAVRYPSVPLDAASRILDACLTKGVDIIDLWHPDYPPLLREIQNPPLVLFLRGKIPAGEFISIVGTRASDAQSARTARRFAAELASAGFIIASGMAMGIDREAHLGALGAGGRTVGVLANGIDIAYPAMNRDLFSSIAASQESCLVSEYPPGIMAGKWTFVRRNRIISGLSRGTLVVKAGEKSGALITARYAAEQGREVFACPGPALDAGYAGCHGLIKSGAALASNPADVLAELGITVQATGAASGGGPAAGNNAPGAGRTNSVAGTAYAEGSLERNIINRISSSTVIDEIIRALGVPAGEVHRALNLLEIEGVITKIGTCVILNR